MGPENKRSFLFCFVFLQRKAFPEQPCFWSLGVSTGPQRVTEEGYLSSVPPSHNPPHLPCKEEGVDTPKAADACVGI